MSWLALLALLGWAYLALLHGRFWQAGPVLAPMQPLHAPRVAAVVPARDEAAVIGASVGSLLAQDYAGGFHVVLVDDGSADGTADIARGLGGARLAVIAGTPRPAGWAGKLWAVQQGVAAAGDAEWLLLTDADIVHDRRHVATLVAQAERSGADMVSEMVALNCSSAAERALVPAFVYFFQMLYPFARVNDPASRIAAAAGGTILVRRETLARVGGIAAIKGALIDDVALAASVKRIGRIWLGHSGLARSIRPYPDFADIWRMIARSAYVQLRYSPLLLAGTTFGLALLFVVPPAAAVTGHWPGLAAWAVMAATFLPTLRRFRLSPLRAPLLPLAALFYMAATLGSALDHHRGRGVVWKNRAYTERQA
ncbi:MAG: glycosyltransferase [Rhodospirillales bacterium]|nr:glycosyltransferase [Rhodospirillales bacterium]